MDVTQEDDDRTISVPSTSRTSLDTTNSDLTQSTNDSDKKNPFFKSMNLDLTPYSFTLHKRKKKEETKSIEKRASIFTVPGEDLTSLNDKSVSSLLGIGHEYKLQNSEERKVNREKGVQTRKKTDTLSPLPNIEERNKEVTSKIQQLVISEYDIQDASPMSPFSPEVIRDSLLYELVTANNEQQLMEAWDWIENQIMTFLAGWDKLADKRDLEWDEQHKQTHLETLRFKFLVNFFKFKQWSIPKSEWPMWTRATNVGRRSNALRASEEFNPRSQEPTIQNANFAADFTILDRQEQVLQPSVQVNVNANIVDADDFGWMHWPPQQEVKIPSKQDEDKEDMDTCKICFDCEIQTAFVDCGHMATCFECANKLKECPICRNKILKVLKIYKA